LARDRFVGKATEKLPSVSIALEAHRLVPLIAEAAIGAAVGRRGKGP
jgi:hypothetical protein